MVCWGSSEPSPACPGPVWMGSCLCLARCVSECCDEIGGAPSYLPSPWGHGFLAPWVMQPLSRPFRHTRTP